MTERIVPKRLLNVVLMFVLTIVFTFVVCWSKGFLIDQMGCILFLNLVFFVVVIFKSPDKIGYGTIANMVFVGYISDFFRFIYSKLLPADFFTGFAVRVGVLIPALIIFIFGAAMYMTAGLGTAPYDAMPYIISEHLTKIPFKYIRMTWDIVFMALGWLAGGNIGVVTIVVAFFLGPVIAWEQKKLAVFIS